MSGIINEWEKYEYKGHNGDIGYATKEELKKIIKRAAKTANQRLVRLERAGKTEGAYKYAMANLSNFKRTRFAETEKRLSSMNISQLRREYSYLRDFISAKSSTLSNLKKSELSRYEKAVNKGYSGTLDQFRTDVGRYYQLARERLLSSETIYRTLTGRSDSTVGDLDYIIKYRESHRVEELKAKEVLDIMITRMRARKRRRK